MMRRRIAATVAALAGLGALFWVLALAPPPPGPPVEFSVEHGTSLRTISRDLRAAGLIRSPRTFELLARLSGADRDLRAGSYELPAGATPWRLLGVLRAGVIELHQVTIPEGLWMWETAGLLASGAGVDSSLFVALVTDSVVVRNLGVSSRTLEGYLFPDTYDVPPGREPWLLIEQMVRQSLGVLAEERARNPEVEMSDAEVLVLASIVEAEARVAEERPRIAAVYLNRLARGWRLEADPTVLYAFRERRPRLFHRDLTVDSPWNTYRVLGLPPTPICSPGRAAIRAVFSPEPSCEDMFFVAEADGHHSFSKTRAEHDRHRRRIQASRRAARRP